MKIKIVANAVHDGETQSFEESLTELISDPPAKKDTVFISSVVKKIFEKMLNRTAVVKTKVRPDEVFVSVNVKPLIIET